MRPRGFSPALAHGARAFTRPGGSAAKTAGFTLIEVLLATVLLATALALAFATLSAATRTASRGETLAQRSERERAVAGFLRKRLAAARPVSFATDDKTGEPQRFVGEPDRLRFVADLPDYLGRGGPYLHDLAVADIEDAPGLTLDLQLVLAGQAFAEDPPRPPEVLVDGLREAKFRYRGLGEAGGLGEWQDRWTAVAQLPLLVEISLTDADGRPWPPLVVALPLGTSVASPVVGESERMAQ
jgi:general secretion pathway protein J